MLATLQGLGCSAESVYRLLEILNPLGRLHVVSRLHLPYFTERSVVHISKYRHIDIDSFEGRECDWTEASDRREGIYFIYALGEFPCRILTEVVDEMRIYDNFHGECFGVVGRTNGKLICA